MILKNGNGNGHIIYLSQIKKDVLNFIKHFIETYDYAPTYKEISEKFNFTRAKSSVL